MEKRGDKPDAAGSGKTVRAPLQKTNRRAFQIGLVIVLLSLISGFATYLILTGLTPIIPTHGVVVTVLLINTVLVLAMIGVIAWQCVELWLDRKREAAGAKLHLRIVSLFSIIAVIPAILLAVFASVSLDRGLDQWFSARTKSIVNNSIDVAVAYVREHGQVIRADIVGMAKDLDQAVGLVRTDPQRFSNLLTAQAALRALPSAFLIDEKGKVLATAANRLNKPYTPPPQKAIKLAQEGKPLIIGPGKTNKVRAIKKLENFRDTYLYVSRSVNPKVIRHLRETRARVAEYRKLKERRTGVQVAFALMYTAIALTLLLAAIWLGLWFANRLVAPIRRLIGAAQSVSEGDLDIRLKVREKEGDMAQLSSTFNKMTTELKNQRNELVDANAMLDDRRHFMEAVLSGVTAGVIGINTKGEVTLVNRSAEQLLDVAEADLIGKPLGEQIPKFKSLLKKAKKQSSETRLEDQVNLFDKGVERNFAVRLTRERAGKKDYGFVLTFDDITELVSAQRKSAWADVARRIAHEIKNPLTPIQLSAERIRRKYARVIGDDRDVFDKCTETIIRHVRDIGSMVDEFSTFARMPKPVMEPHNINEIVKESIFLFQVSHPEIDFQLELPDNPVISRCDRRMISQAVTNLVKNASEAISSVVADNPDDTSYKGNIITRLSKSDSRYTIEVIDNGCGLPKKDRNRLVEPYMTTREKGTGLGLAIVQKITEQHGGTLRLQDAPKKNGVRQGALIRMTLPITEAVEDTAGETNESKTVRPAKKSEKESIKTRSEQGVIDGV